MQSSNLFQKIHDTIASGAGVTLKTTFSADKTQREVITPPDDCVTENGLAFCRDENTLVEHMFPNPRLILLGGGHVSLPLVQFGAALGFDVWVYDDRLPFANPVRFPDAHTVICDDFTRLKERVAPRTGDYVCILTRGHLHDITCLKALFDEPENLPRYVGMIGAKRRIAIVKDALGDHPNAALFSRLHAPIGLPIGSVTPGEIAVSVLAEIICKKRLEAGGKCRQEGTIDRDVLSFLAHTTDRVALATVVATTGSTPREVGAKMVVTTTGKVIGSIGGGCSEAQVIRKARDLLDTGGYCLMQVDLSDKAEEEGMVCGGTMEVLLDIIACSR